MLTSFVRHIAYNAKSQRIGVQYANGADTTYVYDDKTFRLIGLKTVRPPQRNGLSAQIFADASRIQDLNYTYDPVGNITRIADHSLRTVFHRNQRVDPTCCYTYDPLYRLIKATGRESVGQTAFDFAPPEGDYRDFPFTGAAKLGDLQALRQFAEHFDYDPVGSIRRMTHRAEYCSWTRQYAYREESLLERGANSNRLSQTYLQGDESRAPERYLYDADGNIVQMPHLPVMQWDFMDRLAASARQVVNGGSSETTFYRYDAAGQRVRKITERRSGMRKNERLYVGGFEVFREYDGGGGTALERETLHVMDDKQRIALVETLTEERGNSLPVCYPVQRFQFANHLGSSTLELDEAARLISYEEYAPYGGTVYQAGSHAAEVRHKRYRYTGKERDEENGFTYHGARYYAPWLGRWTSADPADLADGVNSYIYARDTPIRLVDPNGTQSIEATEQKYFSNTNPQAKQNLAHFIEAAGGFCYNPKTASYATLWNAYLKIKDKLQGQNSNRDGAYNGPSVSQSDEPYDRRHRYIRTPVDDPLQYELTEVYATADEAAQMQTQVDNEEALSRYYQALAAGSQVYKGSASKGIVPPHPAEAEGAGEPPPAVRGGGTPTPTSPPPPDSPPPFPDDRPTPPLGIRAAELRFTPLGEEGIRVESQGVSIMFRAEGEGVILEHIVNPNPFGKLGTGGRPINPAAIFADALRSLGISQPKFIESTPIINRKLTTMLNSGNVAQANEILRRQSSPFKQLFGAKSINASFVKNRAGNWIARVELTY